MKKYLETPEEVIDALHEGKTIVADSGEKIRLYKGILIGKLNKTRYIINTCITSEDDPYFEEPKPLKIEVGKFYKTRAGDKARCFYIGRGAAHFTLDGMEFRLMVSSETGCVWGNKREHKEDIIGPWED